MHWMIEEEEGGTLWWYDGVFSCTQHPLAHQQLKDSGILILPDSQTLRDYSNCYIFGLGLDSSFLDLVKKDFLERSDPKDSDSWLGLIHDEDSIRKDLVFDDTGKLIGFVDLGLTQNRIDEFEKSLSSEVSSTVPEPPICLSLCLFSKIGKCLRIFSNHHH